MLQLKLNITKRLFHMCSNHKLAYTVCKSCDKNNNVLLQAGPLYLWGDRFQDTSVDV